MKRVTAFAWLLLTFSMPLLTVAQETTEKTEKAEAATATEAVRNISKLVTSKKLDEAKAAWDAARKQYPDNAAVRDSLYQFYIAGIRSRDYKSAAGYLSELVDAYAETIGSDRPAPRLAMTISSYLSIAGRAGMLEDALKKADAIATKLEADESEISFTMTSRIRQRQAMVLLSSDGKKARALLENNLAAIPGLQETPGFQGSPARGLRNARGQTRVHS